MGRPSAASVQERLATSYRLDLRFWETMSSGRGATKERALRGLVRVLAGSRVAYAISDGVAVELHSREPRTTLDIDVALPSLAELPAEQLRAAGFRHEGRFAHSDNWRAPGEEPRKLRTAIQFSADELTPGAVARAQTYRLGRMGLRVVALPDFVLLKLAAAEEPRRRPSKRQSDVTDVMRLLEEHPELATAVQDVRPRLAAIVRKVAAELEQPPE